MLWLNHVHITYFMKLGICSFKCEHFNRPKMKRKILKNCLNLKMLKIVKSFFVRMLFVCGKIFKDIHVWAFFLFLSPSLSTFTQHSYNASFMNQYFCHECEFFTFFFFESNGSEWWGWKREKLFFLEIERAHISSLDIRYTFTWEWVMYNFQKEREERKLGYSKQHREERY